MTAPGETEPQRVPIMGVHIDALTANAVVETVSAALKERRGGAIITPNLDQLRLLHERPALRQLFERADLVVADGMPLVWAAKVQGTPLPERVAGSDLVWALAAMSERDDIALFLLGGAPSAADRAAEVLRLRHPRLRIGGTLCPPFGFEMDPRKIEAIIEAIRTSGAQMVYVALGFPKQDELIARLREELPGVWMLGCGISLSFIAGDVQRAPRWMRAVGLEWSHRLMQEPRRLAGRYLRHDLRFAVRLYANALKYRANNRGR